MLKINFELVYTFSYCSMPSADALIAWFDLAIETLPETPLLEDGPTEKSFLTMLDDPPIGISQHKMRYRPIPLKRCGPKGWTYWPVNSDGTRLARVSYQSPKPNVYITAMVKLIDYDDKNDTDTWTVSEYALVTVDNLLGHGKGEMRNNDQPNKRRKLCILH